MARVAVWVTLPSLLRGKKSQNRLAPACANNWEGIIRPDRNGIGVRSKHKGARSNSRDKKVSRLDRDSLESVTRVS